MAHGANGAIQTTTFLFVPPLEPITHFSIEKRHYMQTPLIVHNHETDEYFFEEGCYILEVFNAEQDAALSIARARLLPATETRLHRLSQTVERYIIISGRGEVTVGEQKNIAVGSNDVVIIPQDCPQMIRNTGDSDLIFLVVCTPRFLPENYHNV